MIGVGAVSGAGVPYRLPAASAGATAEPFDAAFAQVSKPATIGDVATISDAARSRLADPMARYYGAVPVEASPEKARQWIENANAVSRAQGLPEGQYDFSRITAPQINAVIEGYMAKGVPMEQLNGLMLTASQIQDLDYVENGQTISPGTIPFDAADWLRRLYDANVRDGGASSRESLFLKGSLDVVDEMTKVVRK